MRFIPAPQGRLVSSSQAPVEPAPASPATPAPEQTAEPRGRIVAALRRRGEGGESDAVPLHHPADGPPLPAGEDLPAPDLPALASDLPTDDTRAPQDRFTRDVQRAFLEALAVVGSVRDAARRVGVSHMSAYRARRKCAAFRQCWDAALVLAIPHAEEELTCRAINGGEEDVMYRGEVVHTRIRKDSRLLLAHLGRLDRKAAQPQAAALAECFDDALEALGRGEDLPETSPEIPAPVLFSGPCNRCNTSPAQDGPGGAAEAAGDRAEAAPDPLDRPCDCVGARFGTDGGQPHFRRGPQGPEHVPNVDGSGPCCDAPRWPQCRDCPHYPQVGRVLCEMEEARPEDAPSLEDLGDPEEVEACQLDAFQAGDADWWRYGEEYVLHQRGVCGYWSPVRAHAEDGQAGGGAQAGGPDGHSGGAGAPGAPQGGDQLAQGAADVSRTQHGRPGISVL